MEHLYLYLRKLKRTQRTILYIVLCWCLIIRVASATCSPGSLVVDGFVRKGRALDGAVFWTGHVDDIAACAISCMRRKLCKSFNYDLLTRLCELNYAVEGQMPFRTGTNGLMYSSISQWPPKLDPSCSSRPCTADQVCIPGVFGTNPSAGSCSYLCMDSFLVCPIPYQGFSGDRRVGAVTTVTCPRGEVGSDSAECLVDRQWSKTLNLQCTPLYGYACTSVSTCDDIDGVCSSGTCQCPAGFRYASDQKRCTIACTTEPVYNNADVQVGTGTERLFTCDPKYRPTAEKITCEVDVGTQTGSWKPVPDVCTELYGYSCSENSACAEIDGVCTSGTCQCPDGFLYDTNLKMCLFACATDPVYENAVVQSGTGPERQFTCNPNYRKVADLIECVVVPATQTGSWIPTSDVCTEVFGSACTSHSECSEIAGVCTNNVCACSTIHYFDDTDKMCKSIYKLEPGTGGNGRNTGQLHIYHDGKWNNLCNKHWSWKITNAICRSINASYTFGGTYHPSVVYGSGADPYPTVEYHNPVCGEDVTFADCTVEEIKDCDHDKDLGLTCYDEDIIGSAHVRLNADHVKDGPDSSHRLEVKYDGTWGTVCKNSWDDKGMKAACRTMDPSKPNKAKECKDSCAGGAPGTYKIDGIDCDGTEPHLFYCPNAGWDKVHNCPGEEVGLLCKA